MTPQGQQPQPPQQQKGWFARNWMWVVAVLIGVPMLCCVGTMAFGLLVGDDVAKAVEEQLTDSVRVDCGTPGPSGVDCQLKRTAGLSNVEVCWDLKITCVNGGVMNGHACADLAGNAQAGTQNMPVDSFDNQEGCDAPKNGEVVNLVVNMK